MLSNIHLTPLIERCRSNLKRPTDNYVVACVTRSHDCLAIVCRWKFTVAKLSDKVARLCYIFLVVNRSDFNRTKYIKRRQW